MSLNWNLSKIKNSDELCWPADRKGSENEMNPITNALIWATMSVGIGQITEKNYIEFFGRCELISRLSGAPLREFKDGKRHDVDFTLADIKAHIGLSTNVSREASGPWGKRIVTEYLSRQERRASASEKEVKAA